MRKGSTLVMDQPKIYKKDEYRMRLNVLQPVYPLTAGLSNHAMQKAVDQALCLAEFPADYLPRRIAKENKLTLVSFLFLLGCHRARQQKDFYPKRFKC